MRRAITSGLWLAAIAIVSPALALADVPPPANLQVFDTPNDSGRSLTLTWDPSPADVVDAPEFSGYLIERSLTPSETRTADPGPFVRVGETTPRTTQFIDVENVRDDQTYLYRVSARRGDQLSAPVYSDSARSSAQWFHTGRVNSLLAVLLLSGLVVYFIERARRGQPIFIRKIAGLDAVDEAVGRATEMGRKILFIPGTQDMDNVQTLAGISILGRVARLTAEYGAYLHVPVSRSLVMVACRETVKEAYIATGHPDLYSEDMVRYVTDDQFGYAAALDGIMVREKPATIFMQGIFYAESLLLAETGNSINAVQIAGTAEPSQLPFFVATCDYTLIGEELFAAGAYLSREPRQLGSLKGQDMGKAIILVVLLVGIVLQTAGIVDVAAWFTVQ